MLVIRDVENKDWNAVKELYNEWRTEKTYSVPETILSDLSAKRKTRQLVKDGINLVAEKDQHVIGLLESNVGKLTKTKHTLYINQMNVLKKYRRLGIGKKLILELIKIAKKHKVKMVYLNVVSINKPAIKLYSKLGFEKTGTILNEYKFGKKYVNNDIMCILLHN